MAGMYSKAAAKHHQRIHEELKCKHRQLQAKNKRLKHILNKAEVALLIWNPEDMWFPQIKQQYSELMDEIHNILKRKPNAPLRRGIER